MAPGMAGMAPGIAGMAVPGALRSRLLPRGLQAGGLLAASLSSPVLLSSAELEPGSWHHDGRFFWSDCERRSDSLMRVVRMLSERAGSWFSVRRRWSLTRSVWRTWPIARWSSGVMDTFTHHVLNLPVTEAVEESGEEALERGEEGRGERPEGEV